ncbi:MAG: radical SAM protein [Candidatus Paceibacterota bacterium]
MSLGVLKLAAVLKQSFAVDVLDLSGIADYEQVVKDYLQRERPLAIGLTATTPQMPAIARIVTTIRQGGSTARIILGGTHVTLVNASARQEQRKGKPGRAIAALQQLEKLVDVLVAGDGEKAILEALRPSPPKLIDADDAHSSLFLTNEDLDLVLPDRRFVDVRSYHYEIDGKQATSIVSQLGCPFGCSFCGGRRSPCLRRMRSRSVGSITGELKSLHQDYGLEGFMFFDDELNVNPRFPDLLRETIRLQESLGVEFRLRGFVKSQLFTKEQAELMYEAGFRWALVGFESGSDKILRNMNKRASVNENVRCVRIAKQAGLKIKALTSLGHPGESPETARATLDWLLEVKPDDFDVSMITVYPGTPYYDDATPDTTRKGVWVYTCQGGDRLYSREVDWLEQPAFYKGDPNGGYAANIFTEHLSPGEIVEWRGQIESEVRGKLNIPWPTSEVALAYEHSMGMSLPPSILRSSD